MAAAADWLAVPPTVWIPIASVLGVGALWGALWGLNKLSYQTQMRTVRRQLRREETQKELDADNLEKMRQSLDET